ncbi:MULTISPECIES: TOBE domain-containing protein [unclassified Mesorhizobium]|uniref:TOBE domain-containing protein n=1 Tax=unclassified Mesorhizobium TaxID=325217 RepID=UPI0032AFE07F
MPATSPPGNDRRDRQGATTSHVTIDIGGGAIVTASITNKAVADLKLKRASRPMPWSRPRT